MTEYGIKFNMVTYEWGYTEQGATAIAARYRGASVISREAADGDTGV